MKNKNIGILITDHNVQETLAITDRTYLMFEGNILRDGKPEDLAKDDEKSVGKVIKGLKKAVKIHQGQVDSLTKDIKDSYEYGTKEATENSLNMTPGQSTDDWNKQVGIMQEKQTSMREAIAKMWGVEEGHNPFKKEEVKTSKKEGKTMTGKSETKVTIGMKEK